MNWKAVLFLPLLLAGCASPYMWVKNGATPADYDRDLARCRYEAASATASYSSGRVAPTLSGAVAQGFGEGMAIGLRQSELITLCLQANGYTRYAKNDGPPTSYASTPVPVAAPQKVPSPATIAVKKVDPVPANAETERVVQVLADSGFPLVGVPNRIMQKGNLTYYEAWGTGGRLTQVVCENGKCRIRTIYD